MTQRTWGLLENYITKSIAQRLHRTKLNIIWIALQKERWSAPDPQGERRVEAMVPMIQGAASTKLPAMCKLVIHADRQFQPDPNNPGRMLSKPIYWTGPSILAKEVRHKYGLFFPEGCLTDPELGTWPTYRAVESRIGQFIYK